MPSFMDTLDPPWRSMPMVPFLSPFSTTSQQPGSRSLDTIFASNRNAVSTGIPSSAVSRASVSFVFMVAPSLRSLRCRPCRTLSVLISTSFLKLFSYILVLHIPFIFPTFHLTSFLNT